MEGHLCLTLIHKVAAIMQSLHILLLILVSQPRATPVPPCLVLTIGQVPDTTMWCSVLVLFGWKALIQYVPSLILIYQGREFRWFKHLRASCGSGPSHRSSSEEALLQSSMERSISKISSAFKYTWLTRRLLSMRHLLRELQQKDKTPYSSSSPPYSHEGGKSSCQSPTPLRGDRPCISPHWSHMCFTVSQSFPF